MLPPVESQQIAYAWASRCLGRTPEGFEYLSGGYSNDNYLMLVGDDEFVVRFCDRVGDGEDFPGIDRERERTHIEHAGALTAELVHFELPAGHMITRRLRGRHPLPGKRRAEDLATSAALLRRVHALPTVAFHYDPFEVIVDYLARTRRLGTRVPSPFERIVEQRWTSEATHFCHNDFNPWNLILGDTEAHVLDWEWAGTGDPFATSASR